VAIERLQVALARDNEANHVTKATSKWSNHD